MSKLVSLLLTYMYTKITNKSQDTKKSPTWEGLRVGCIPVGVSPKRALQSGHFLRVPTPNLPHGCS